MRLLELFSGTRSIGRAFIEKGFEVVSVDIDPKANATHTCNILDWDCTVYPPDHFDVVWGFAALHHVFARSNDRRPKGP